MHLHPTISIWQRAEDGSYTAELNGFQLGVRFQPETAHSPRGFLWTALTPGGARVSARESQEEIEIAMAAAEALAEGRGGTD